MDIVNTLHSNVIYTQTLDLKHVDVNSITSGNNTVVARCRLFNVEQDMLLKCYHHSKRNTSTIYGDRHLTRELGVYTISGTMEYVDVVLTPWIAGEPLDYYFQHPEADYRALSNSFDRLALATLRHSYAHGDIKPENIIVTPDDSMQLVDYDAAWVPGMKNSDIEEFGSPSYSHLGRRYQPFNKNIDDFSIALLSTTLAALAADRATFEPHLNPDNTLFDPCRIVDGHDPLLNQAIALFERRHDTRRSYIAKALYRCHGPIAGLGYALQQIIAKECDN